jgi:cardiolipin synthase
MKRLIQKPSGMVLILGCTLLSGCGYRAPMHASYIPEVKDTALYAGIRPEYLELAALMEKDVDMRPTSGNTVTLIADGPENWELLKDEFSKAKRAIYVEPYRFKLDTCGTVLAEILRKKALEGVDVRLLLDKSANTQEDRTTLKGLRDVGARVYIFHRPAFFLDHHFPSLATHRDHRKLTLLDGRTALVGSRNIQDKYFFDWHDVDIRVTGPVVADLTRAYRRNQRLVSLRAEDPYLDPDLPAAARADTLPGKQQYFDVTMQVVPETPADRKLPVRNCFEWAIRHAKDYFWFYNPYTPPPETTIQALQDAARRGVDVRWIVPGINDVGPEKGMAESMYQGLLDAGVRIYEWQEHTMHAKQYLSDDYLVILGSANMDNLSLFLNYEMVTILYDERICRQYAEIFRSDLRTHCVEVKAAEVQRWSIFRRLRNWFIRVLGGPLG